MKKILFFSLILFAKTLLFAQYNISGQIKDKENNKGLQYCNVILLNNSNKTIGGCLTDKKGFFTLDVGRGNYKIIFGLIGYKTDTISTGYIYQDKFLGVFKLAKDVITLKEVKVKGSKISYGIDKDVVLVTEQDRKNAVEVADILEKINGVSRDRLTNTIKVDNSANVKILLNNTEKDASYIRSLNPRKIKKVEIIRYPGGKYGLENYDAVINIITFKNYTGYDLYANDMALFDLDNKNKIFPKNDFEFLYNYTYNKFNFFVGVTDYYSNFNTNQSSLFSDDSIKIISSLTNNDFSLKKKSLDNSIYFGADYYINPKSSISLQTNIMYPNTTESNYNYGVVESSIAYDTIISRNNFLQNSNSESKAINNYIFYQNNFNQADNLKINYNLYFSKKEMGQNTFVNDILINELNNTTNSLKSYLNAEFSHSFSDKVSIDIGGSNIYQKDEFNYKYSESTDTVFENNAVKNNVYSYLNWSLSKKMGLKFGAAVENYKINNNRNRKNYNIINPLFNFRYLLGKLASIRLTYNVKSYYPTSEQTSPYTIALNHNSYVTGNPDLAPAYINQINLSFNLIQNLIRINPYYNFSKNYITQVASVKSKNVYYTYQNVEDYSKRGIRLNLTLPFGKNLFVKGNIEFFKSKIKHNHSENEVNDWNCDNQLIYMNRKINTIFIVEYQRNSYGVIDLYGYKIENFDYWLAGVQKRMLKNRLKLMIGYILPTNLWTNYTMGSYQEIGNVVNNSEADVSFIKNVLILKLTYRIGKGKVKTTEKDIPEIQEKKKGLF